jgi:hypothetical protein
MMAENPKVVGALAHLWREKSPTAFGAAFQNLCEIMVRFGDGSTTVEASKTNLANGPSACSDCALECFEQLT